MSDVENPWGDGPPPSPVVEPPPVVVDAVTDYVRRVYGYLAGYLDHPEIGPILRAAAVEEWSPERLQGAVTATSWWRQTSAAARTWDLLASSDPATAAGRVDARYVEVRDVAGGLGVRLGDGLLRDLAARSLRLGWTSDETSQAVGNAATWDPGQQEALLTSNAGRQVTTVLADYALPLSGGAREWWTNQIVSGRSTVEQLRVYAATQAEAMFPTISDAIRRGQSVRSYVDPYLQIAADTLETDVNQIDLSDRKWLAALDVTEPGGTRRAMTFNEWAERLRSDEQYGYDQTRQAQDKAWQTGYQIARLFGKVA